jgi:5-formyltetrahydrofolate cyclo-ligase
MRNRLAGLSANTLASCSESVVAHFLAADDWPGGARVVTFFGGLAGEPNLLPLLPRLHSRGVRAAFLAIEGDQMRAHVVNSTADLVRGPHGVWIPRVECCPAVTVDEISVILTPGLAFSPVDGARLGRGAGFYDRLFATPGCTALRIGVCLDIQLTHPLPMEAHDEPMHALVTESGWVRIP